MLIFLQNSMIILFNIISLIVAFYLLAIVCDRYFVSSLDSIAHKLKMNSDMAGATFMAIGTSAPELAVSMMALFKPGEEAMGAGTIVGSAIFNILVIIGMSAIVRKAFIAWQPVVRDMLFYAISIILLLFAFRDGQIDLTEAILFIVLYALYVFAVMKWKKLFPYKEESKDIIEDVETFIDKEHKKKNLFVKIMSLAEKGVGFLFPNPKYYWGAFTVSIFMIIGLSWVLVESAVSLAHILNIPSVIIGLTVLAAGTSVPDLIASVIVSKQGRGGMAITNAVGSNIFDILICLGLPWIIMIGITGAKIPVVTENLISSVVLLLATLFVTIFLLMMKKWKIGKFSGFILVGLYIGYLTWAIFQVI